METTYKCTRCGAEDHDRGTNGPAPLALNCWKCGAGRGKDLAGMVAARFGMLPVAATEPAEFPRG